MRFHALHAYAMGKRDVGSNAPTKVFLLEVIRGGRIRPRPHADGLTRGNPERCRRIGRLPNNEMRDCSGNPFSNTP